MAMENRVVGPAIGLIVAAAIAGLFQLLIIAFVLLGAGAGLSGFLQNLPGVNAEEIPNMQQMMMFQGVVGVIKALVGLAIFAFVIYGALKMKNLEGHTIAVIASIVAMIPCLYPCCLPLGLPFGIWALVVLLNAEVKACFKS
jgi:hypothetical protein